MNALSTALYVSMHGADAFTFNVPHTRVSLRGGTLRSRRGNPYPLMCDLVSHHCLSRTFHLRADACGFGILQIRRFFRLRGWRTRGPSGRALLSITRPQRKGGVDSSSPLDSTLPPLRAYLGDSAALLNIVWSNGGWNKFHHAYHMLIYRGRTRMSGTFYFVACSTPKVQFACVSPFSYAEMKVQRVRVRLGSCIFALHLH